MRRPRVNIQLTPSQVRITNEDIMRDLLFPAKPPAADPSRRTRRR